MKERCSVILPEATSIGVYFPAISSPARFFYCLISFFSTHGKFTQKRGTYFLLNLSCLFYLEKDSFLSCGPHVQLRGAGTGLLTSPSSPAQPSKNHCRDVSNKGAALLQEELLFQCCR